MAENRGDTDIGEIHDQGEMLRKGTARQAPQGTQGKGWACPEVGHCRSRSLLFKRGTSVNAVPTSANFCTKGSFLSVTFPPSKSLKIC